MSSTNNANSIVGTVAESLGVSEPAFRLLLTILAGYPLAAIYRKSVINIQQQSFQHVFFAASGIILCYFNYGYEVYHSLISILLTYIWIKIAYNSKLLVTVNFIFHMVYLLAGYYFTESDDYDIKWTMPHCVLVLRLIGIVYDISDGKLPSEKLSNDQKENAISEVPLLHELLGFAYFPASFIVGPQYSFRRYQKFINKEYIQYKDSVKYGLKRGSLGILYLLIRQIGSIYVPDNYLLSAEFKSFTFIKKLPLLAIWGKIVLYKYIACWLIAEGSLSCFGLTFVNVSNGKEDWSGCTNVRLFIFETAGKLGHYIESFNVNTNHWVASYVYKRLKFLGNRMISQAAALLFLAVWHGFHVGYYICFSLEFSFVTFERQIQSVYDEVSNKHKEILESNYSQIIIFILRKIYTLVFMGWCLVPFVYFNYNSCIEVFSTLNYFGFIFLVIWFTGRTAYVKYFKNTMDKND